MGRDQGIHKQVGNHSHNHHQTHHPHRPSGHVASGSLGLLSSLLGGRIAQPQTLNLNPELAHSRSRSWLGVVVARGERRGGWAVCSVTVRGIRPRWEGWQGHDQGRRTFRGMSTLPTRRGRRGEGEGSHPAGEASGGARARASSGVRAGGAGAWPGPAPGGGPPHPHIGIWLHTDFLRFWGMRGCGGWRLVVGRAMVVVMPLEVRVDVVPGGIESLREELALLRICQVVKHDENPGGLRTYEVSVGDRVLVAVKHFRADGALVLAASALRAVSGGP